VSLQLQEHYQRLLKLEQNINAAQSNQRFAAAAYADAEAERLAAGERRKLAEMHLATGSLGSLAGMGLVGGV
jgi:hypothetical protein